MDIKHQLTQRKSTDEQIRPQYTTQKISSYNEPTKNFSETEDGMYIVVNK